MCVREWEALQASRIVGGNVYDDNMPIITLAMPTDFDTERKDWKLGDEYEQSDGIESIEACYEKARGAGVEYFSYRNDGGKYKGS